jgi:NADPH:quinone reductase-like Zn-dependent oxidoreductase
MPIIVRFREVGGPEVLRIEEEPPKQPGKGAVRLKVQAVGLNRAELMFMRDQYVEHPKLPGGLGYEAAGLVEAIGSDWTRAGSANPCRRFRRSP